MRLTIKKRKRYRKKQNGKILIILFVIAPLISISLGYALTKNLVVPYINKEQQITNKVQKDVQATKNGEVTLKSIQMYNLELDRFKSLENAKEFVTRLNNDGMLGYVSQKDEYIVYTSLTLDKQEVELQKGLVEKKYPQVMIKSVETEEKKIDTNLSEKNVLEDIKITVDMLNDSYKSELNMWLENISATDYYDLKTQIDKNNKKLNESIKKYSEKFTSQDIKNEELNELYLILYKTVENREKISKEFDDKNMENVKNIYYEFVKSLFNYINYYKI